MSHCFLVALRKGRVWQATALLFLQSGAYQSPQDSDLFTRIPESLKNHETTARLLVPALSQGPQALLIQFYKFVCFFFLLSMVSPCWTVAVHPFASSSQMLEVQLCPPYRALWIVFCIAEDWIPVAHLPGKCFTTESHTQSYTLISLSFSGG